MAIQGRDGLKVREEQIDRAYSSGMIGFLERWSRKKAIDRKKNPDDVILSSAEAGHYTLAAVTFQKELSFF